MTRLYELADSYALLAAIAEEDNDDGFAVALADLQDSIANKADNIARLIRSLDAEGDMLAAEAKRLLDKSNARANRVAALKNYLMANLIGAGLDKVKTPLFIIAVQDSPPSLKVLDADAIPDTFRVYPPSTWRADARAIIQLWHDGQAVPGTEVVRGRFLAIR